MTYIHSTWHALAGPSVDDLTARLREDPRARLEHLSTLEGTYGTMVEWLDQSLEEGFPTDPWVVPLQWERYQVHRIVGYVLDPSQLFQAEFPEYVTAVIGAASVAASANFVHLRRLQDAATRLEGRVVKLRAELTAGTLSHADMRINSVRVAEEAVERVDRFRNPDDAGQLLWSYGRPFTGISAQIDEFTINMYNDSQVFFWDVRPDQVPPVITRLASLWRIQDDRMLQ